MNAGPHARFSEIGSHPSDLKWKPVLLSDPIPLYRSVSVQELQAIWSSGSIEGGGNLFNEFEERPFVFFGDRITPFLIWQGEDVERAAVRNVSLHYASEERRLADASNDIEAAQRRWEEKASRKTGRNVGFSSPKAPTDAAWTRIRDRMASWLSDRDRVNEMIRSSVRAELETLRDGLKDKPFTSAILETRPITGCRMYEGRASREPEYGFLPGEVKLSDIVSVRPVRDRKVLASLPIRDLDGLIAGECGGRAEAEREAEPSKPRPF